MKKLSEEMKEDLEELLIKEKNCSYTGALCEEYLFSLSKRGYDVKEYKNRYYKLLLEKVNR